MTHTLTEQMPASSQLKSEGEEPVVQPSTPTTIKPASREPEALTKYGNVMMVWLDPEKLFEHPEAGRIPEMSKEQFKKLCDDMALRGYVNEFPIHLMGDGRTIIDGRHRCRAAKINKLKEVACVVVNPDDPVEYMYRATTLTLYTKRSRSRSREKNRPRDPEYRKR